MPLPSGITTTTISFGPYTDATGTPDLVGKTGKLFAVDPSSNRKINLVDQTTGQAILPDGVTFTIAADGTASVGPIPNTGQSRLSPAGYAWRVEWDISTAYPSPGNRTFMVDSGSTADYDLLASAAPLPTVVTAVGPTGPAGATGPPGIATVDNADGTFTIVTGTSVTDNGDGTYTIAA